ncbi:DNA-binding response regulator [Alicyclobacillus contaminans]|uniref:response regulator transcription factor n=1 Tax=Alicyclobacillus contaminans TaxID=392016 RepID=UPI0004232418|nr:response regulator transcription factor [Alicyclobacillus contaminans]GMA48838.1 DNA-binding response regulator [Alicyclobacillus contaminans]
MQQVLIVDDEASIVHLITGYLRKEGFSVLVAETGPEALEMAKWSAPDLIILDVMLPDLDGFEVCRRLRQTSMVPILMLTAKAGEADKIIGLGIGADDYLTKPFSPRELVARVKALLRRANLREPPITSDILQFGDLTLDLRAMSVRKAGKPVNLTAIEFQLLKILATHPGQVFTKQQLLDLCWGYDYVGDDRLVVVHIANVRKKLEDNPAEPMYIQTIRGVGYAFRKDDH